MGLRGTLFAQAIQSLSRDSFMAFKSYQVALLSEHASPLGSTGSTGGVDAGGQNVYVDQVARSLAALGHRVDVFTRRDDATLPSCVDMAPGVRVFHLDAGPPEFVPKEKLLPYMLSFTAGAHRLFERQIPYQVVHANFFMSGLVGLALRRRFQVPLVTAFDALGVVRREHQGEQDSFASDRIAIERALVRHSNRLIAECPQDALDLQRLYGVDPRRITSVACGVDTSMFRPGDKKTARERLGLPADEFIVLQLRGFVSCKGIDNMVRAMAHLPSDVKARLVVVGGESYKPNEKLTPDIKRLRGIAREAQVSDRLQFVGARGRHQLRDWYVAADVFVTTPSYESFGITPLEAMACATPVVGSAVGNIQHMVVDGITGYLVPPHDPIALGQKLMELHRQPALAQQMGLQGMRRVRQLFTWDRVAIQLDSLYTQLSEVLAA
jgi:D-inositol-3-phosphate glycosyltransferase